MRLFGVACRSRKKFLEETNSNYRVGSSIFKMFMVSVVTGRALAAPLFTSDFVSNKALCFLVCCFCKHTMGKSFSQLHIFIK